MVSITFELILHLEVAGLLPRKIGENIHIAHTFIILGLLEDVTSLLRRCY